MVQSSTLFRRAAGVYHYLAHEVLPSLQGVLTPEGPPEATSSVSSVMSLICLAEAQVGVQVSFFILFSFVLAHIAIIFQSYFYRDVKQGVLVFLSFFHLKIKIADSNYNEGRGETIC